MKKTILILILVLFLTGCKNSCEDDVACPLPADVPTATATILPSPEPSPQPTPEPTPMPLLPVELADYSLPEEVYGMATQQGWVETMEYETRDYVTGSEEVIYKSMHVYKPYDYDPNGQYDVLFLMHIAGWDETYWFGYDFALPSPQGGYTGIYLFDMIDKMTEQGRCRPTIVVSLDGFLWDNYRWNHMSSHSYQQFHHEFANDIMPKVVENLATYANGTSREEMSKAREHFGFFGASYGAYLTNNCILRNCLDLVSNFALTGGGTMDYNVLASSWASLEHTEYPINCLYLSSGEYDNWIDVQNNYYVFKSDEQRFDEENLHFTRFSQTSHEPREWVNALYNSLQLMFR